jgi:hypothetical protein
MIPCKHNGYSVKIFVPKPCVTVCGHTASILGNKLMFEKKEFFGRYPIEFVAVPGHCIWAYQTYFGAN